MGRTAPVHVVVVQARRAPADSALEAPCVMPRPITLELAADSPMASSSADTRAAVVGIVEDLLTLLEGQFPAAAEFPADSLRSRLQHSRERLRASEDFEDVTGAGLRLVADASQAHARLAAHTTTRESEFLGVIRLLRELVDGLRGDAQAFRHDLMRSSERVADLSQIEDLRTLRRALNREVDQLRHCVSQGEKQESSRLAEIAGDLKKVDALTAQGPEKRERSGGLPPRAVLFGDLASSPREAASLVVCRIDEPDTIVDVHGTPVLERVILAMAQLLKGTFGKDVKVYRTSTQCVAIFLPKVTSKQAAQQVRHVQSRVAPEYEYERLGVTRRVVFTFSAAVANSPGRHENDATEAFTRAEARVGATSGLGQLHAEASGLGRLVGWLASGS
jgi:GGDEF domain-containing protein